MKLYSYFRSSCSYRVRIALNLKGLDYEIIPVHLLRNGGENNAPSYRAHNPLGLLPTLSHEHLDFIQSLAIMEYLEERFPEPPLLPRDEVERARVRALSQTIACEIQPLNNLRVKDQLRTQFRVGEEDWLAWYRFWIEDGFYGLEQLLADHPQTGRFCQGDRPTLADCCLVPQVYNARRYGCDLHAFITITRINDHCEELAAFAQAAPDRQEDALPRVS